MMYHISSFSTPCVWEVKQGQCQCVLCSKDLNLFDFCFFDTEEIAIFLSLTRQISLNTSKK